MALLCPSQRIHSGLSLTNSNKAQTQFVKNKGRHSDDECKRVSSSPILYVLYHRDPQ